MLDSKLDGKPILSSCLTMLPLNRVFEG